MGVIQKAQMSNWTAEEVDVSADMDDWNKLSENERHFVKYILAFFAGSDGIVFENINNNFADEVQYTEARSFYAYQVHNEMVHGETYSKLIDKYIRDGSEKTRLLMLSRQLTLLKEKPIGPSNGLIQLDHLQSVYWHLRVWKVFFLR